MFRTIVRYVLEVPGQPPVWIDDEDAARDALADELEDSDDATLERVVMLPLSRRRIDLTAPAV